MSVKFYTDAHISKAIVDQARKRGVDIIRCQDVKLTEAEDIEHLNFAVEQGRTVISADADFPILDAQWRTTGKTHAGIIYILPDRKDQIGRIVDYLEFLHQAIKDGAATLDEDVYNKLIYL